MLLEFYYLNQQLKTIQEELGGISYEEEIDEMKVRAKAKVSPFVNDYGL